MSDIAHLLENPALRGKESLTLHLMKAIDNFGPNLPKTSDKLMASLRKWRMLVDVNDPLEFVESLHVDNLSVTVGSEVKVKVSKDTLHDIIASSLKKIGKRNPDNIIALKNFRKDGNVRLKEIVNKERIGSFPVTLLSVPTEPVIDQTTRKAARSLVFKVNGSKRSQNDTSKKAIEAIVDHAVVQLEKHGYIVKSNTGNDDENIKCTLPSDFMMYTLKNLIKQFQNVNMDCIKMNSFQNEYTLKQEIIEFNLHLNTLKENFSKLDQRKSIQISNAVDALHKYKDPSKQKHVYRGSSLFNKYFVQSRDMCSSTEYNLRSGCRKRKRSSSSCSSSEDSSDHHRLKRSRRVRALSSDYCSSVSDGENDDHDNSDPLLEQAEVLSTLLGLEQLDLYSTDTNKKDDKTDVKIQQFDTLLNCMKTLQLEDVEEIPQDLEFETLYFLQVLDKLDKPKTLKGLKNILRIHCKFVYIIQPQIQITKPQRKTPSKTRSELLFIARYKYSESVELNATNLLETNLPHVMLYQKQKGCSRAVEQSSCGKKVNQKAKFELTSQKKNTIACLYSGLFNKMSFLSRKLGTSFIITKPSQSSGEKFRSMITEICNGNLSPNHFDRREDLYQQIINRCVKIKEVDLEFLWGVLNHMNIRKKRGSEIIEYHSFTHNLHELPKLESYLDGSHFWSAMKTAAAQKYNQDSEKAMEYEQSCEENTSEAVQN